MRKADIKSLIWLTRWYNGRAKRLQEIHQSHLANLEQLVLDELGEQPQDETILSFYGFNLVVYFGSQGIEVTSINPPQLLDGAQLALFNEDEFADWFDAEGGRDYQEKEVETANGRVAEEAPSPRPVSSDGARAGADTGRRTGTSEVLHTGRELDLVRG